MQAEENKKNEEKSKDGGGFIRAFGEKMREKLRNKDELEVRRRLGKTVDFLLTATTVYITSASGLFFGTYPISIALACSSRQRMLAVLAGLTVSALALLPSFYIYTCIAVLLIRMLAVFVPAIIAEKAGGSAEKKDIVKFNGKAVDVDKEDSDSDNVLISGLKGLFCEKLHVRLLVSAVGGLLCGLFLMISGNYSFYSLYATLVLTFITPLAVLCLGGVFGEQSYGKKWYTNLSLAFLVFLAVFASADLTVLGMPLSPCLAMLLTLYFSSEGGVVFGSAAAIISGAAFQPMYIPLLLLSAIIFCLVSAVKRNAGIAAVCALIVVWCYYIGGTSGLVSVLPPMLLAVPLYMIADKYREMMKAPYKWTAAEENGLYFAEAVTEKSKNEAVKEKLDNLSEVFSSLSETFYKLSDRFKRPDILGIRRVTDSAFESLCADCRDRERCWGAEHSATLDAIGCVTSKLHTKGAVKSEDLPADFKSRCVRSERLIDEVNAGIARSTENVIKSGKMNFFAANYDDITAILKDALESDSDEYECFSKEGGAVFDYLCEIGIRVSGVVVYGKRCKHVIAKKVIVPEELTAAKSREISQRIGEIVGADMSEPMLSVGKDGNVLVLHSRPSVKAVCAHGRLSRGGKEWSSRSGEEEKIIVDPFAEEECCGDVTDAFITDNSYFYALISDGMGSGAEAAYISGVCSMFIEKMLSAGNRVDITLRMLNNVIRNENMGCGSECSATVDLFELDLMNGTASFIKSGAAPTYIARGETVYKISSRTMPVGIIKDADARITKFDTKKGDIIVMMSDGCCHDSEDCPWLVEYLCAYMSKGKKASSDCGELCERLKEEIIREAVKNLPEGEKRDDISVSVVVIG